MTLGLATKLYLCMLAAFLLVDALWSGVIDSIWGTALSTAVTAFGYLVGSRI